MVPCPGGQVQGNGAGGGQWLAGLAGFRERVYGCLRRRADCLFELVDAVLCTQGRVESLVELSAQSRFRRGHGALYDAVACGEIDIEQLAGVITSSWKPSDDGPLKFVIDVSAWHRPYAECSAQRHHCNTSCACGNRSGTVAGWPYSMCAGLEWGRSSWSAPLDARRLDLADDATEVGLHQKLARQAAWLDHPGELPNVAGTVIRIQVEHLPGDRDPEDLWLWHHAPNGTGFDLDLLWMAYLRRFDIEHTFRFFKQSLGWTSPQIATPAQGDRWTWLILIAYTQLRLARELGTELRRPWQRPLRPDRLPTPGQVRRGFPTLARKIGTPAGKPKPSTPGPGRPKGTTRPPRTRHPAGKNTVKPDKKKRGQARPRS